MYGEKGKQKGKDITNGETIFFSFAPYHFTFRWQILDPNATFKRKMLFSTSIRY